LGQVVSITMKGICCSYV